MRGNPVTRAVASCALLAVCCAFWACLRAGFTVDAAADSRPRDATADSAGDAAAERAVDGGIDADSAGDLPLARDGGPPDTIYWTPVDGMVRDAQTSACSVPGVELEVVAEGIVICGSSSGLVSQCEAAALCNAGWRLCPGSTYIERIGLANPIPPHAPTVWGAWIAACVRDGGDPIDVTDDICTCSPEEGTAEPVVEACFGVSDDVEMTALHVGMVTFPWCTEPGGVLKFTWWWPQKATDKLGAAVCCQL